MSQWYHKGCLITVLTNHRRVIYLKSWSSHTDDSESDGTCSEVNRQSRYPSLNKTYLIPRLMVLCVRILGGHKGIIGTPARLIFSTADSARKEYEIYTALESHISSSFLRFATRRPFRRSLLCEKNHDYCRHGTQYKRAMKGMLS